MLNNFCKNGIIMSRAKKVIYEAEIFETDILAL